MDLRSPVELLNKSKRRRRACFVAVLRFNVSFRLGWLFAWLLGRQYYKDCDWLLRRCDHE